MNERVQSHLQRAVRSLLVGIKVLVGEKYKVGKLNFGHDCEAH